MFYSSELNIEFDKVAMKAIYISTSSHLVFVCYMTGDIGSNLRLRELGDYYVLLLTV